MLLSNHLRCFVVLVEEELAFTIVTRYSHECVHERERLQRQARMTEVASLRPTYGWDLTTPPKKEASECWRA